MTTFTNHRRLSVTTLREPSVIRSREGDGAHADVSQRHEVEMPTIATPMEVSTFTRIAPQTLARWRGEGKGPKFSKAGSRVLYRREDVLAWLDRLETGGEAA